MNIEIDNKQVSQQVSNALNLLCVAVNRQIFEGCREWHWVGDAVGGVCCFDDTDFLNTEDMLLILEKNITYEQYEEWHCAELDNPDIHINLRSWLRGARHQMLEKRHPSQSKS